MKIRAIVTGATGMVGEGVLHECLQHPDVEHVLVINRKPGGVTHPKLEEIIHTNFFDLSSIESKLTNYNACFFCLGVSSIGMKEPEYHRLTYDLTMQVAKTLVRQNPGMTFCYVSGSGTDSTEKGKLMWARVKGKTENDIMKLPFKNSFMFRPGLMKPTQGLKNTLKSYKYINWLYPVLRKFFPNAACELREVGLAMINTVNKAPAKRLLEVKDIVELAKA
jgi:uncharacterized protein YbjT (DUF2867 family)